MKPEETGPLPFKTDRRHPDPFIDAILRNPQPLIMVSIGLVGMILFGIATAFMGGSNPPTQEPAEAQAQEPLVFKVEREDSSTISATANSETPSTTDNLAQDVAITQSDDSAQIIALETSSAAEKLEIFLPDPTKKYISIIIDDIGNNIKLGTRAIELPGEMTFAILPHTPFGTRLAELSFKNNKEIMLHAPMSNQAQLPLGPGALTPELNKEEFVKILTASIEAIPHLKGINNHMGSALTEMEQPMQWVMEVLNARDLYFVDSRTTAASVAANVAKANNIPSITRNVFLDNEQNAESIDKEFKRMLKQAQEYGSAVGIGHPYKETLDYLEQSLPTLAQQNIELIFASKMIQLRSNSAKQ